MMTLLKSFLACQIDAINHNLSLFDFTDAHDSHDNLNFHIYCDFSCALVKFNMQTINLFVSLQIKANIVVMSISRTKCNKLTKRIIHKSHKTRQA